MPDLAALPDGTRVFVGTNIFHFHFQGKMNRRKSPLRHIATYDGDFDHIPGLTVWQPTDITARSKGTN